MNAQTASYKEGLWEDLRDPEEAAAFLNAVIEDGEPEDILRAFQDVAAAWNLDSHPQEDVQRFLTLFKRAGLRFAVEVKQPAAA